MKYMGSVILTLTFITLLAVVAFAAPIDESMPDFTLWYSPYYWAQAETRAVTTKYKFSRPITIKTINLDHEPVTVNYNQVLYIVSTEREDFVTDSKVYKQVRSGYEYHFYIRDKSLMAGISNRFIMKILPPVKGVKVQRRMIDY